MADEGYAAFLYQVKGVGTRARRCSARATAYAYAPAGQRFPRRRDYDSVAVVGGGFGIAPLYMTAAEYGGRDVRIYNGFSDRRAVMLEKQFAALGKLTVCTDNGSKATTAIP